MKISLFPLDHGALPVGRVIQRSGPFSLSPSPRFYPIMVGLRKCPGCLRQFTSQTAHFSQTSNPLCRRLAKKRRSGNSGSICVLRGRSPQPPRSQASALRHSSPMEIISTTTTHVLSPVPPSPKSPSPGVIDNIESSDDEDELDFFTGETTPGWEPPAPHSPEIGSHPPSDTEDDIPPTLPPPHDIRQRTWATTKVVRFPDARAGEPTGSAPPSHNAYANKLGTSSPSNPYSLFTSKVDWEVAEWAKLHGPSSTSFADLLKIDGVRDRAIYVCIV